MKLRNEIKVGIILLSVAVLAFAQAAWAEEFKIADRILDKVQKGEPLNIKVVYHNIGINFAMVLKRGVEDAAREFGVNAEFTGPVEPNVETQVAMIENFIASEVDGLAISNVSAEALNPVIERALNAGIPVVTFNSDAPGSNRLAFLGKIWCNLEGPKQKFWWNTWVKRVKS